MSWTFSRVLLVSVVGLIVVAGCSSVKANVVRDADLSKSRTFYVEKNEKDKRGIEIMLRDELRRWGRRATCGPQGLKPGGTHVLVTYADRWHWDLRMYMRELKVEFRDPETGEVVASVVSRRDSLTDRGPESMVWVTLVEIFEKAHPEEQPPPDPKPDPDESV